MPQGCVLLHPINVAALPGQGVLKGKVLSFYSKTGAGWEELGMLLLLINELLLLFQIKLKINVFHV